MPREWRTRLKWTRACRGSLSVLRVVMSSFSTFNPPNDDTALPHAHLALRSCCETPERRACLAVRLAA